MNGTCPGKGQRKRGCSDGFTLVELMVVIAVIGLLVAVGIPAFQNLGRTAGIDRAASQVSGTLSLARQWAITRRERVYVVFPVDNPSGREDYRYRSFNVYTHSDHWLREWNLLPEGIVFNASQGGNRNVFHEGHESLEFGFSNEQPALVAYPNGRVLQYGISQANFDTEARVYIMEGFVQASPATPVQRPGETLERTIRVHGLTGGIEIVDEFL